MREFFTTEFTEKRFIRVKDFISRDSC